MKSTLLGLAHAIADGVGGNGRHDRALSDRSSPGGDAQFRIDDRAEDAAVEFLRAQCEDAALFSEGKGFVALSERPQRVFVVDPIDGTRPAAAGFAMSCVSVAVAPLDGDLTIGDVEHALLMDLPGRSWMHVGPDRVPEYEGHHVVPPSFRTPPSIDTMFWSFEFNGHPASLMTSAYGHLIDRSANSGGVFVINSASFSISRIITGQLDAYVDIGNRILRDHPDTEPAFRTSGRGNILHLFPYDIAAAVVLATAAGVTITDAYGAPLDATHLTDVSPSNQRSCIAASTPELHAELLQAIRWDDHRSAACVL